MYNNNNFCFANISKNKSLSYEKKKELFKMLISKYPKIIKIDKKIFFNKLDKTKILLKNSILIFYNYKK